MANISISLKKYKADYSRFLHNAKVLRLTFQTPAQRNDNPTWACAESSSPKKLLPAAYCRHCVVYLKVPTIWGSPQPTECWVNHQSTLVEFCIISRVKICFCSPNLVSQTIFHSWCLDCFSFKKFLQKLFCDSRLSLKTWPNWDAVMRLALSNFHFALPNCSLVSRSSFDTSSSDKVMKVRSRLKCVNIIFYKKCLSPLIWFFSPW